MNRQELKTIIEVLECGIRLKEEGCVAKVDFVIDTRSMKIESHITPVKAVNEIHIRF